MQNRSKTVYFTMVYERCVASSMRLEPDFSRVWRIGVRPGCPRERPREPLGSRRPRKTQVICTIPKYLYLCLASVIVELLWRPLGTRRCYQEGPAPAKEPPKNSETALKSARSPKHAKMHGHQNMHAIEARRPFYHFRVVWRTSKHD